METEKSDLIPLGRGGGRGRGIRNYEMSGSSPENVSVTKLLDNVDLPPRSLVLARGRGRGRLTVGQCEFPSQDVSWPEADIQTGIVEENFIVSKSTPPVVEAPSDSSEAVILQGDAKGGGDATKAEGEFSPEQVMEQLKLSTGFEKVPVPGESANVEPGSSTKGEGKKLTRSPIEEATEFREDAILSPEPMVSFMYCCFCGVPAGKDAWTCYSQGHSTCNECKIELDLLFCHYVCRDWSKPYYCRASLHKEIPSFFRDYFFDNTKFGCINYASGCQYDGLWEDVKIHQKSCQFTVTHPSATDSAVKPKRL